MLHSYCRSIFCSSLDHRGISFLWRLDGVSKVLAPRLPFAFDLVLIAGWWWWLITMIHVMIDWRWVEFYFFLFFRDLVWIEVLSDTFLHSAQQGNVSGYVQPWTNIWYWYDGIKLSHERAFEYYDQAAHLGHAQAQYNLGVAYATDDVVLWKMHQRPKRGWPNLRHKGTRKL